jgi:GxxExxY protein
MQPRKHESTKKHEEERKISCSESDPLPEELEALVYNIIGCCIAVHRALGPGLLEATYRRAICLELTAAGHSLRTREDDPVTYRGELLCEHRLDFVVGGAVILEIKSVEHLVPCTTRNC